MLDQLDAGRFDEIASSQPDVLLGATRRDDTALRETVVSMARAVGPGGLRAQLHAQLSRTDLSDGINRIDCPVLVVSGEQDDVCPARLQAEIVAAIPGAVHEIIADAGHAVPLEQPGQLLDVIDRWTAGLAGT
jgi:pimeloyl-ACP methyl ester carboxylesterase